MKDKTNLIKSILLFVTLIIAFFSFLIGTGLEDFAEIAANAQTLCLSCIGIG